MLLAGLLLLLGLLSGSFVLQRPLPVFIELEVIQDRCFGRKTLEYIKHADCLFKLNLFTKSRPLTI
jgi:hypothetical protein